MKNFIFACLLISTAAMAQDTFESIPTLHDKSELVQRILSQLEKEHNVTCSGSSTCYFPVENEPTDVTFEGKCNGSKNIKVKIKSDATLQANGEYSFELRVQNIKIKKINK